MVINAKQNPIKIKCQGADSLPIDLILEFQGKLKKLSETNRNKLMTSICTEGFIAPLFVWDDAGDYKLLDGHQRLSTLIYMREKGWDIPLLPVVHVSAENEKDARRKLLKITSQYGEFDLAELQSWIDDLGDDIEDSIRLVDEELELVFKLPEETLGDDKLPESVEPITQLGDLWELGDHRVLCGDSRDLETVEKLMDGRQAALGITDPPYNVSVNDESEESLKKRNRRSDGLIIENDKMSDEDFLSFLSDAFARYNELMLEGGSIYVFYADSMTIPFLTTFKEAGFHFAQNCIWNKQQFVMTRKDYHYKHEPIMYGWKKGSAHSWMADRKQSSVWNFDRPFKNELHPTMKPINLLEYPILNSSSIGSLVADLFLGSGSTLITCEKTNRICYGMELDPHYCDVIRDRYIDWCKANDKEFAVKLNGEIWNG